MGEAWLLRSAQHSDRFISIGNKGKAEYTTDVGKAVHFKLRRDAIAFNSTISDTGPNDAVLTFFLTKGTVEKICSITQM